MNSTPLGQVSYLLKRFFGCPLTSLHLCLIWIREYVRSLYYLGLAFIYFPPQRHGRYLEVPAENTASPLVKRRNFSVYLLVHDGSTPLARAEPAPWCRPYDEIIRHSRVLWSRQALCDRMGCQIRTNKCFFWGGRNGGPEGGEVPLMSRLD